MNSGIYKIINKINGKFYIGSSVNLSRRKSQHFSELKKGLHPNIMLQRTFNKNGIINIDFQIISFCPPEYCIKLEQWFINNLKPYYNICKIANSSLEFKHSEESKLKMKNFWDKRRKTKPIKMSKEEQYNKLANKLSTPILEYDINGNFVKEWNSIAEASRAHNTKHTYRIWKAVTTNKMSFKKFWRKKTVDYPLKIDVKVFDYNKKEIYVLDLLTNLKTKYSSNLEAFKVTSTPNNIYKYLDTDKIFKKRYKFYKKQL